MILRSVTKHVKDQNWFAVFIDFLIVVVGVFIGIQVANWNEGRAYNQQEAQLLSSLKNDIQGMKTYLKNTEQPTIELHKGWMQVFRSLEACEPFPEDDARILAAFSKYQTTIYPIVLRTAYDEMKSLGVFSRLKDRQLQESLAQLYSTIEMDLPGLMTGRQDQLAAGRVMWKSIPFSFASDDPKGSESDTWATIHFNPLEHCDNLELRGAIWEMVDLNRDYLSLIDLYTEYFDKSLKLLNAKGFN